MIDDSKLVKPEMLKWDLRHDDAPQTPVGAVYINPRNSGGCDSGSLVGEYGLPNGVKFDSGKLRYGLLPEDALKEVVQVLTNGATKYSPGNWRFVEDAKERYFDAAQRHIWSWKSGELLDEEFKTHHLAGAICCLMFLLDVDIKNLKQEGSI